MTNFERIKAMSFNELLRILYDNDGFDQIDFCKGTPECRKIPDGPVPEEMCLNCLRQWLESEVEE